MGMLPFDQMVDAPIITKKKRSDTIYTLDIEVTSLFKYKDGWDVFRPELTPRAYDHIDRAGVPYIWMFGIEADGKCNVYYGREFMQLDDVFRLISDPDCKKVIWIHNAGYEFQFLRDIFDHYTITNMCCRKARKPIRWCVDELNLEFRCSYMLTNLSLEKAAQTYTDLEKKSGDLDYQVKRHPKSDLTLTELGYCEYDIRTLHAVIAHFRDEYGSIAKIPLTATGEVRYELRSRVGREYFWNVQKQTASNAYIQMLMMKAFMGGICHASYLHSGRVLYDLLSGDQTSAYPGEMLAFKHPCYKWVEITSEKANSLDREKYCVLYHVRMFNIECRLINTYILGSKCLAGYGVNYDNGRVLRADVLEMVVTDVDFDIIRRVYDIEKIEYIETYMNWLDWLPKELIEYILDLYEQKTALKGITSEDGLAEARYRKSKSRINALYGCCVTSIFKGEVTFKNDQWETEGVDPELIEEKLEELRKSRTNCFAYQWGIYCTARVRKRTFEIVEAIDASKVGIDKGAIYYDTDSCKAKDSPEFRNAMEKSNKEIRERLLNMCSDLDIDPARLSPKDKDGVEHPIGVWEIDGEYDEFKTLGAKRYAYKDKNGLHITVSGVDSKKGVAALRGSLQNFKPDMIFEYENCGKLASFYNDDQPVIIFKDYAGKKYASTQRHGICLQGVEYNMSVDDVYEALWDKEIDNRKERI